MTVKKDRPQGIVYGAEQQGQDEGGRKAGKWYAVVYDRRATTEDGGEMYRGTSGYDSKLDAVTEAEAWTRDRKMTAHPF